MRTAACLAILAALSAAAADPKAKPIPGLKDAQDRYAAALAKAKKEHDAAVKDAAEFYVASLKDIQAERTKAGDLDGAVRVRDLIAEAGAEGGEGAEPVGKEKAARAKLSAALVGKVFSADPGVQGWGESFAFRADGFVYSPAGSTAKPQWRWEAISPDAVLVISNSGVIDYFAFSPDRKRISVASTGGVADSKAKWGASLKAK